MEFISVVDDQSSQNLIPLFPSPPSPVSHSQVSPQCQEVLMENTTTTSEHSRTAQKAAGEASAEADLLENIWKLENLFQNHSEWLQRLEILIRVGQSSTQYHGDLADCYPAQGLELELRNLQVHSHQSEGYLVHLDDRLSSLSSSAERNISSLISEVSRTSTLLHNQEVQLRCTLKKKLWNLTEVSVTALVSKYGWISSRETSGQLSRLRENLDEVNWTVGAVNHTFSSDISFHRLKIQDMQVCLQKSARCQKIVRPLTRQCHPDSDQQHYRGHQQPMGDARPHGGPAEERDGHPQHHHWRPPPEGLGALAGPEEHHHIGR